MAAHLGGGAVDDCEAGGVSVGGVDDAAVGAGLAHLSGNFLDVVAVGQAVGERRLIKAIVGKDLLGVLADGHVAVADGEHDVAALEEFSELVEALDALGVALGNGERDLVLKQVDAAVGHDEVKTVGVLVLVVNEAAVHGVHLLGGGGDEQVAVSTLADLGEELARGVKVVGDVDVGGNFLVHLGDLRQSFGHGGSGEDDKINALGVRIALGVVGGCVVSLAAAGGQREHERKRKEQRQKLFHVWILPFKFFLFRTFIEKRGDTGTGENTPHAIYFQSPAGNLDKFTSLSSK